MAFPFSQQIVALHDGVPGDRAGASSVHSRGWFGKTKVAYDSVHGYIQLEPYVLAVVDTAEFQRLRDLKQLGTCYFVFPGASHNRFEHSLGVSHLSGAMIDHIRSSQPSLRVTEQEARFVKLAGLVHDLGHGPFSHVFDGQFIPSVRPGTKWHHETMSAALLDVLLDDNEVTVLDDPYFPADGDGQLPPALRHRSTAAVTGREVVKYMMHPDEPVDVDAPLSSTELRKRMAAATAAAGQGGGGSEEALLWSTGRQFLFEIVANASTGIDTDKFDYLMRDTHNLGLMSSFDYRRVMAGSRVMPTGHIAYHYRETMTINEMFHTRYNLFRTIYLHRATRSLEAMICDALKAADAAWNGRLSKSIDDPRLYRQLTDSVLWEIQNNTSNDPQLVKAREIVLKMRRRQLYRFVDEILVPEEWRDKLRKFKPEDVSTHNPDPNVVLRPQDIIISDLRLGYGMGSKNPMNRAQFWYSNSRSGSSGGGGASASIPSPFAPTPGVLPPSMSSSSSLMSSPLGSRRLPYVAPPGVSSGIIGGRNPHSMLGDRARGGGAGGEGLLASPGGLRSSSSSSSASAAVAAAVAGCDFEEEWATVSASRMSHLLPRVFEERLVRVYSRETDKHSVEAGRKMAAIAGAFRLFLRSQGSGRDVSSTWRSERGLQPRVKHAYVAAKQLNRGPLSDPRRALGELSPRGGTSRCDETQRVVRIGVGATTVI